MEQLIDNLVGEFLDNYDTKSGDEQLDELIDAVSATAEGSEKLRDLIDGQVYEFVRGALKFGIIYGINIETTIRQS